MSNQRTQDRAITLEAATNAIVKAVQDSINTTQRRVAMDTLFCLYSPNNPLLQGDNMGSLRADAALSALDEARSVGLQNVSAAWLEFVQDSIVWKEFCKYTYLLTRPSPVSTLVLLVLFTVDCKKTVLT